MKNLLNIIKIFNVYIFLRLIINSVSMESRIVEMHRKGCGEIKGCLFKPAGCDPQLDCTIGIIFYVSDVNLLTIQLVAQSLVPLTHYQYIAIGFSEDNLMGDDYVSECVLNPGGGSFNDVEVFASYNNGKANDRTYLNFTEHTTLFTDIKGEIVDGRLMCQFTQQIIPQINNKSGRLWDLNQKLFIIGATGSAQPDEINVHDTTPGSHFYPITTARPINPSLVGPKIYELPASFKEDSSNSVNKTEDDNRTNIERSMINHAEIEAKSCLPLFIGLLIFMRVIIILI